MRHISISVHHDSKIFLTNEQEKWSDEKLKEYISNIINKQSSIVVHRIDRDGVNHASGVVIDIIEKCY